MLIEVCVDTADGLAEALAGGADRIELCSALELGGLTPSPGLIALAAKANVPVYAMIRPRGGNFCFSPADERVMAEDIMAVRQAGLAGVVIGAAKADRTLDLGLLARLAQVADGLGITLHRVFDEVPDQTKALEQAIHLGLERILTSGGAKTAPDGASQLARLIEQANGRIVVMPAAGINASTVAPLRALPLSEVHGSCSLTTNGRRQTAASEVRALRAALT
jgi:copper homeostasis protein